MTSSTSRVFLILLAGSVLVGPFLGLSILLVLGRFTSHYPWTQVMMGFVAYLVIWIGAAAPVTLPGALLGGVLAIRIAKRKTQPWTRLRWAAIGALAGATLAMVLSAAYFSLAGSSGLAGGITLHLAFVLGLLIGAGTTWAAYGDLESMLEGRAA